MLSSLTLQIPVKVASSEIVRATIVLRRSLRFSAASLTISERSISTDGLSKRDVETGKEPDHQNVKNDGEEARKREGEIKGNTALNEGREHEEHGQRRKYQPEGCGCV